MASLKNPNYSGPVEQFIAANKAAIQTYLANNAASEFITFDKIRADNPGIAAKLTDATLAQICNELGIQVAQ